MFKPGTIPFRAKINPPSAKALCLLLFCLAVVARSQSLPPRTFLHPDRIRYDSQCFTIDGKDVFLFSGAFHYFRCPKELWPDRFQKIKDAGFNCVETYVPWNLCEPQMPAGLGDFSQVNMKDLDDFLTLAERSGLYVIVRPGPYICAEWDTGGYPQWLLTKQPVGIKDADHWLRSDDPVYLAWCKHWCDAVCPVIAPHQITHKSPGQPGVILVQLENEYDYANFSDTVKINQIKALGQDARADGIDVPFITCWTHQVRGQSDPLLRQVFDCCNFYPRWNVDSTWKDIAQLRREQPDAPLGTTELQGGWFAKVGDKLSAEQDGLTASQINNLTLFAIQNGETLLNYYMLFGGTNPGDRAARDLTTTYDYNAPIREWGGIGPRYQRIWAIGRMLQEHGSRLARSTVIDCDVAVPQKDVTVVMRRTPDGSRYLFVRTSQHDAPRTGTAHVKLRAGEAAPEIVFDYNLEPFGSTILYLPPGVNDPHQGEWLPKPAPPIERPTHLPAPVIIPSAVTRDDPGPVRFTSLVPNENLAEAGIYDSHFIYYRGRIVTPIATNLSVEFPAGDAVLAAINSQPVATIDATRTTAVFPLATGANEVDLLYENRGHDNGGYGLGQSCGIRAAYLTGTRSGAIKPIGGWRMRLVDGTKNRPEIAANFDDSGWSPVSADSLDANQLSPNQTAVFRAGIDITPNDLNGKRKFLTLGRVDDTGWVFVNGHSFGKTTDWSQAYTFDVTSHLHPGHNTIAVIVKNVSGGGGLGQPTLDERPEDTGLLLTSFGRPAGDEQQWWVPNLDTSAWKSVAISSANAAPAPDPLLTWYRLGFALPSPQPGVWVPWRLHLTGTGNGFLYLNGHELGRYWQSGPQQDFFLPECWLNFGPGQTNNLTLDLRPVNGSAAIQTATVEPYFDSAEKR